MTPMMMIAAHVDTLESLARAAAGHEQRDFEVHASRVAQEAIAEELRLLPHGLSAAGRVRVTDTGCGWDMSRPRTRTVFVDGAPRLVCRYGGKLPEVADYERIYENHSAARVIRSNATVNVIPLAEGVALREARKAAHRAASADYAALVVRVDAALAAGCIVRYSAGQCGGTLAIEEDRLDVKSGTGYTYPAPCVAAIPALRRAGVSASDLEKLSAAVQAADDWRVSPRPQRVRAIRLVVASAPSPLFTRLDARPTIEIVEIVADDGRARF